MFKVSKKVAASNRRFAKGCAWAFIGIAGVVLGLVFIGLFFAFSSGGEGQKATASAPSQLASTDGGSKLAGGQSQPKRTFDFTSKQWAKRFTSIANDRAIPTLTVREKEKCLAKCSASYKLGQMSGVIVASAEPGGNVESAMMMVSTDGSGESSAKALVELVTMVESFDRSVGQQDAADKILELTTKLSPENTVHTTVGGLKLSLAAPKGMGMWLVVEPK